MPTDVRSPGTADQPSTAPSGQRGAGLFDVDQECLELRGLRIGITDGRGQRVGAVTLASLTGEPPMDRHADHMSGLAVYRHRANALGYIRLAGDHPALRRQT